MRSPRNSVISTAIERASTVAEHAPAEKKTEKAKSTPRQRGTNIVTHVPGAKVTPAYVERTPRMWAVGEVDIKAISDDSLVANFAFSIGSFFLGFAVNILVDYGGVEKLTETGAFMLHKGTWVLFGMSLLFFLVDIIMTRRKNAIWEQIKKESKDVP